MIMTVFSEMTTPLEGSCDDGDNDSDDHADGNIASSNGHLGDDDGHCGKHDGIDSNTDESTDDFNVTDPYNDP